MTDRHTDSVTFSEAGSQALSLVFIYTFSLLFYSCILKHGEIKWKKLHVD